MRRRLRHLTALFAIAFFFAPLLLLAGGVRATQFENRKLAGRPSVDEGWAAFDSATTYLVDHLPLREQAVRANTWKSLHLFGTAPTYGAVPDRSLIPASAPDAPGPVPPPTSSQVLVGIDGWLYLQADVDRACNPYLAWDVALARWERLARVLRTNGKTVVLAVAPDKSTVYPNHLPTSIRASSCLDQGRDQLWQRIRASNEPALLDGRHAVEQARDDGAGPVFFTQDSHWNSRGSLAFLGAILRKLDQPLNPHDVTEQPATDHHSDLAAMLGAPALEPDRASKVARSGVAVAASEEFVLPSGATLRVDRLTAPPRTKLRSGLTIFVHDSFGAGPLGGLQAHSSRFGSVEWATAPPEDIAAAISMGDTVVLQTVEREFTYRASTLLTPAFFELLEQELDASIAVRK